MMSSRSAMLALAGLVGLTGLLAEPPQALAHTSATAEARLEVIVGPDRTVESVRHVWRFDADFTETLIDEFDQNENEILDPHELEEVSKTIRASIADLGFFQLVAVNGSEVAMQAPDDFVADMQDGRLIVLFESRPKAQLRLEGTVEIGVFDPTFTTIFTYKDDSYLAVEGLPGDCSHEIVRPDVEALVKENPEIVDKALNDGADRADVMQRFATRLKITCSAGENSLHDQGTGQEN